MNSINEAKIAEMLDTLKIQYKQQYSFDDLYSKRKCDKLYFDIAVFNANILLYLIEYDGIQHFESGHFNQDFSIVRTNDLQKNKYCFEHNIPIIRIPYNKEYNINDLKLETTRYLLTPDNEEKYYASIEKEKKDE